MEPERTTEAPPALASETVPPERGRQLMAGAALLALSVICFLPSLKGDFIWGDDLYITQNPLVRESGGLRDIWLSFRDSADPGRKLPQYYPLTFSTFWLEWKLWGANPWPYHLTNIILHSLGVVLLWRLLRRLEVPGAWFAAAIFAIHPIQVDSVAWISERVNTLSGVFFLFAFLLYWRHEERRGWAAFTLSLLAFVLALLSKTTTVVLPAMLVLVRWWKRRPWTAGDVIRLVPYFVLSAGFAWITVGYESEQVGAKWDATLLERTLLAGRIVWFYFAKLLAPLDLMWVYPLWDIGTSALRDWLPVIGLTLLVAVLAATWRRSRAAIAAVGCFLAGLFPVMGFFDIYYFRYSYVADHFNYLPAIAVIALIVGSAAWILRRAGDGPRVAGIVLGCALIAVLAALTWRHQPEYADTETLYRRTLAKNPASAMPRTNLGVHLKDRAMRQMSETDLGEALFHYDEAIRLTPTWADAYVNLGDLLATLGRRDEAIEVLRKAAELNPDSGDAFNNLGTVYAEARRYEDAIACYQEAINLRGYRDKHKAHQNMASALVSLGRIPEAIEQYGAALRLKPDYEMARRRLADLLADYSYRLVEQGRNDEGIKLAGRALELDPHHVRAHNHLAIALANAGRTDEAVAHLKEALWLRPDYTSARRNLEVLTGGEISIEPVQPPVDPAAAAKIDDLYTKGSLAISQGRPEEAINVLAEVLRMDPSHVGAHNNAGIALAHLGRRDESIAHLAEAVRLKPDFAEAHSNLCAALNSAGRLDEALSHCSEAVRLKPDHAEARHYLAEALAAQGRVAEAADAYREALKLRPGWPVSASALAWILATNPDDNLRSGAEAVSLAEEVCRLPQNQVPSTLDALAAAYAEVGRFDDAATTAGRAVQMARSAGQADLARDIEARLRLYQNRQPYRAKD